MPEYDFSAVDALFETNDDPYAAFSSPATKNEPSESWQITKGFKAGIDQTQAMGGGLVAAFGDALGADSLKEWGLSSYEKNMQEAAENQGNVAGFTDIEGFGDAVDWALYTAGNMAPMLGASLASGGAGALAAKTLAQGAAKKIVAAEVAKGASLEAAKKAAAQHIAKSATVGAGVGAYAGSAGMSTGNIYGELPDVENRAGTAFAHGAVAGALDALPSMRILKRLGVGKVASDEITDSVMKFAGKQIATEGLTEGLQTVVEQHAKYWVDENQGMFEPEHWKQIIDASAAGALMGGVSGTATGLLRPAEKVKQARDEVAERGGDSLDQTLAGNDALIDSLREESTLNTVRPETNPADLPGVEVQDIINRRDQRFNEARKKTEPEYFQREKRKGLLGYSEPLEFNIDDVQFGELPQQPLAPIGNEIDYVAPDRELSLAPNNEVPTYDNAIEFEGGLSQTDRLASGVEQEIRMRNSIPDRPLLPPPSDIKLPGPVYGNANNGLDGMPTNIGRMDSDPTQREADTRKAVDRVIGGERYLDSKVSDFNKEKTKQERQASLPSGLADERWLRAETETRPAYKDAVKALTKELVKGGNIAYVRDANDNIIKRTASENPAWAQEIMSQEGVSTGYIKATVDKAIKGKSKLGEQQARVVSRLLDAVEQSYSNDENVNYAQSIRKQKNVMRKAIKENSALKRNFDDTQSQIPDPDYSAIDDAEFDAEQGFSQDEQIEAEALIDAMRAGVPDAVTDELSLRYDDAQELASAIYKAIREQNNGQRQGDIDGQSAQAATPEAGQSRSEAALPENAGRDAEVRTQEVGRPGQGNREGQSAGQLEDELLTSYTEAELKEREDKLKAAQEAEAKAAQDADNKEKSDAQVSDFQLAGSGLPADANPNQNDIFDTDQAGTKSDQAKEQKPSTVADDSPGLRPNGTQEQIGNDESAGQVEGKSDLSSPLTTKGAKLADKAAEKFEDFGETLGGARKHTFTFKEAMDEDIDVKAVPLSKSFPKPDYEKLAEEGVPVEALAFVSQLRANIPTKPKAKYKLPSWAAKVEEARKAATGVLTMDLPGEAWVESMKKGSPDIRYTASVIKLAKEILPSQIEALGKFKLSQAHYQLYRGETNVNKWVVTDASKKQGFGGMGNTAAFNSEKEALAYIKSQVTTVDAKDKPLAKFDMWTERGVPGYFVGKKLSAGKFIELAKFENRSEASNYIISNNDELVELLAKKKKIGSHRRAEQNDRIGKDYRRGSNVTSDLFSETFGFRGVQFGNYVENDKRQQDVNNAYDGLLDLAGVLNIPPKALSLNGELGLAFGARGSGGKDAAKAHFEPDTVVINLTKRDGAGSLAHEWWHALDNYFGRMDGELTFNKKDAPFVTSSSRHKHKRITVEGQQKFTETSSDDFGVRQEAYDAFKGIQSVIASETELLSRSGRLDDRKTKDYWSTTEEVTARSFERYVIEKLAEDGYESDYLATILPKDAWDAAEQAAGNVLESYPYPTDSEMPAVKKAYQKLFDTLKTKETESGVALFARSSDADTTTAGNRSSISEVQANEVINRLTGLWRGGRKNIVLVDTFLDLPRSITMHAEKQDAGDGDINGVFHNGKVYLVRDAHKSEAQLETTLFHEAYGHYGLSRLFGQNLAKKMNALYLAIGGSKGLNALADKHGIDLASYAKGMIKGRYPADLRNRIMMEELLAHIAQDPKPSVKRRAQEIIGAIKNWLRKMGLPGLSKYSDNDIMALIKQAKSATINADENNVNNNRTRFMVAYHGTPHKFDRFSLDAIGSGEGAQAYGWGLYFAGKRGVAEWYRDNLSGASGFPSRPVLDKMQEEYRNHIQGLFDMYSKSEQGALDQITEHLMMRDGVIDKDFSKILRETSEDTISERFGPESKDEISSAKIINGIASEIDKMLNDGADLSPEYKAGANIYEVDIRDDVELMDFDKPLSRQSASIKKKLLALNDKEISEAINSEPVSVDNGDYWSYMGNTYDSKNEALDDFTPENIVRGRLGRLGSTPKDISKALNKAELKGLKYLDGTSRRKGEGHHNYVIWDDSVVTVKAVNDELMQAQGKSSIPVFSRKTHHAADAFSDFDQDQIDAFKKIGPKSIPQRVSDRIDAVRERIGLKVRQGVVDRFAALREVDELARGKNVVEEDTANSAWVLSRMSNAASGALNALIGHGRIYMEGGVIDVDPDKDGLVDVLRKLGGSAEVERFMGWVAGNRSEKLMAEGKENLFSATEVDALKRANSGTMKDGRNRAQAYDEVFKEFQAIQGDVLKIAEQAGIISGEARDMWQNEFYVPFYRVMEDQELGGPATIGGGISRQQAYKKLKGGKNNLNDLLENTLMNFEHLLSSSLKNQAAVKALENAEMIGIAVETNESGRDKKSSTFVLKDGQKVWYDISDSLVFQAVTAMGATGFNGHAMKIMRAFKRVFTNFVTASPQFMIANLMRDSFQSVALADMKMNPIANVMKGVNQYGVFDKNKAARAHLQATGGAFSFGHVYGEDSESIKMELNRSLRGAKIIEDGKDVVTLLKKGWDMYHGVSDSLENANRAALYDKAIKDGKTKLKAAFEARDLMDFSAHGNWAAMRFLVSVVPFLNARVQGLDKIYRAGVKPSASVIRSMFPGADPASDTDKKAAARFATVTGALTMATMALYLGNKDDEDYKKLEDWQKDSYWFIKVGTDAYFIPKPFEVGAIATLAERSLEQFVDEKATGKLFAERIGHMLSDTFSFNPTPQLFKPMIDLYANKDSFTGRPIEGIYQQNLSPSLRTRTNTTEGAKLLSSLTENTVGALLGKDAALVLSPIQVDYLIGSYLGWVGETASAMFDVTTKAMNGETEPAKAWFEYQPMRRFYKDLNLPGYSKYQSQFYDNLREVGRIHADIKQLRELGQIDEAQKLAIENRDKLRYRTAMNRIQRQLSTINNQAQMIRKSSMSAEEKRRRLDLILLRKSKLTEMAAKRFN